MKRKIIYSILITLIFIVSCKKEVVVINPTLSVIYEQSAVLSTFGGEIDLNNLLNYANQSKPLYISSDNTRKNKITDAGATLGRVLFYDKKLSIDNSISCSSCHHQEFAFSDTARSSTGVNGKTGRHSMRLINGRFSSDQKFFWNRRAPTLEFQTTQPIKDHVEMGYSGIGGNPNFNSLIQKLDTIEYYKELFFRAFNNYEITESKIQNSLAQFIRSIQSFDSKYDKGRMNYNSSRIHFSNFTAEENLGKELFVNFPRFDSTGLRTSGGLGCNGCHNAPTFETFDFIDNNGITGKISGSGNDFFVTRAPSLRDIVKSNGTSNGPFMHTGFTNDLNAVLNHYNTISYVGNPNLDSRFGSASDPRNFAMTQQEKDAVVAFLKTLAGTNVYTDKKWSSPF